jgi:CBS domain-containing protein
MDDVTVLQTMRYMNDTKVSGVAVVDKRKRIIANFSATDLLVNFILQYNHHTSSQGLTEETFSNLALTVKDYLNKMHGFPKVRNIVIWERH